MPGYVSADRRSSATGRCDGGSVARSRLSQIAPPPTRTAASSSGTTGSTAVASTVATSGPITKISSSSVDSSEYAVVSSGRPASTYDHRARTRDPTDR